MERLTLPLLELVKELLEVHVSASSLTKAVPSEHPVVDVASAELSLAPHSPRAHHKFPPELGDLDARLLLAPEVPGFPWHVDWHTRVLEFWAQPYDEQSACHELWHALHKLSICKGKNTLIFDYL